MPQSADLISSGRDDRVVPEPALRTAANQDLFDNLVGAGDERLRHTLLCSPAAMIGMAAPVILCAIG